MTSGGITAVSAVYCITSCITEVEVQCNYMLTRVQFSYVVTAQSVIVSITTIRMLEDMQMVRLYATVHGNCQQEKPDFGYRRIYHVLR